MIERPILFKAPMVRAILAGTKTQTRRMLKPYRGIELVELREAEGDDGSRYSGRHNDPMSWGYQFLDDGAPALLGQWPELCPYGQPGDRLWVKETWRPRLLNNGYPGAPDLSDVSVEYAADGELRVYADEEIDQANPDWSMPKAADRGNVSPLFMPRWASRITLAITDVRVQRLQEIDQDDAIAEGIDGPLCAELSTSTPWRNELAPAAVHAYAALWDRINGAGAWISNPWVWALTFQRVGS